MNDVKGLFEKSPYFFRGMIYLMHILNVIHDIRMQQLSYIAHQGITPHCVKILLDVNSSLCTKVNKCGI